MRFEGPLLALVRLCKLLCVSSQSTPQKTRCLGAKQRVVLNPPFKSGTSIAPQTLSILPPSCSTRFSPGAGCVLAGTEYAGSCATIISDRPSAVG